MTINLLDVLSENGLPLYTAVPSGALVMANTTLAGGTFVSKGGNVIRGVDYLSVGTSTSPTLNVSGTLSSSGNHSSSNLVYSNDTPTVPYRSYSPWTGSAGSHSHTISNVFSGASYGLPLSRALGFYSLPSSTINLPSGAIVFAASNPGTGFTATTYTEWLAGANSTAQIASSIGSNTARTWSVSTGGGGGHSHPTSGSGRDSYNSFEPQIQLDYYLMSSVGNHTHTVSMTGNWSIGNYVTAKSFVSNGSAVISKGCIIAWNSASNVLPAGWAFCDGSTVRGVTTPNLNGNRMIKLDPNSHGVVTSGSNYFFANLNTSSFSSFHFHGSGTQLTNGNGSVVSQQHKNDDWFHSHSLSYTNQSVDPSSTGLSFIMYIP